MDAGVESNAAGAGEALVEGGHGGDRLERVLRRHQPPDLIQGEAAQCQAADVQMAFMGRIEGAAQEPDGEAGCGPHRQGRICPVPRTMYL